MISSSNSFLAERWIGRILVGGIVVSVLFLVTGLFLMAMLDGSLIAPAENPPPFELISGILHPSTPASMASGLMLVGLVLLMITPFLRVIATVLVFLFQREWNYVAVAVLVLLMLIGEVVFAFR